MREEFAREFPGAARAIARTRARVGGRYPVLWSEPVVWATVSGIGAGFLAAQVMQAAVGLSSEALQALRAPTPFALFPLITIAGSAAAAAVALGAGGPIALALDLAYVALGVALGVPGLMTFCARSSGELGPQADRCTTVGFLATLWPQVVGIGLGIGLSRVFATRGRGINSLLRVAGAFAIVLFVVSQLWAATLAQTTSASTSASTSALTIAAGIVAAAVAAGAVAAQLPRGIRNAAIVALIWLLPWLTQQVPFATRALTEPIPPENLAPIVVSIIVKPIASVFLVLSAAVAARRRFIPRGAA